MKPLMRHWNEREVLHFLANAEERELGLKEELRASDIRVYSKRNSKWCKHWFKGTSWIWNHDEQTLISKCEWKERIRQRNKRRALLPRGYDGTIAKIRPWHYWWFADQFVDICQNEKWKSNNAVKDKSPNTYNITSSEFIKLWKLYEKQHPNISLWCANWNKFFSKIWKRNSIK